MSCMALSELSLSEQVDVTLAWAAALEKRAAAVLTLLDPARAVPSACHPPAHAASVGSIPLSAAENAAMVEKQYTNHPPLQVCHPGHRPHMWQAAGDRAIVYYVECSLCSVRTARLPSADEAAHAWAQRQVAPIVATVAAA